MNSTEQPAVAGPVEPTVRPQAVQRPYCRECGSEKLRYDYECASGHVYQCKQCGHEMQWTFPLVA